MDREDWIYKRAATLQKRRQERERIAEENGYPCSFGEDVSYEEAEAEWHQMYGYPDEDE